MKNENNNQTGRDSDLSMSAGSAARCDNCKHSHEDENRYDQRWCSIWCENVECSEFCEDHEPRKNSKLTQSDEQPTD